MNVRTRLRRLEQKRSGGLIIVMVRSGEDHKAALERVTEGRGAQGQEVIYVTGGLPDDDEEGWRSSGGAD